MKMLLSRQMRQEQRGDVSFGREPLKISEEIDGVERQNVENIGIRKSQLAPMEGRVQ